MDSFDSKENTNFFGIRRHAKGGHDMVGKVAGRSEWRVIYKPHILYYIGTV